MISIEDAKRLLVEEAIRLRGKEYFIENRGKIGMSYGKFGMKYHVFFGLDLREKKNIDSSEPPFIDETIPWDGGTSLEIDLETGEIEILEMY